MAKCKITSPLLDVEIDVTPTADMFACLLQGLVAAMPTFLEAFMKCIAGQPGDHDYKPGDRRRCD